MLRARRALHEGGPTRWPGLHARREVLGRILSRSATRLLERFRREAARRQGHARRSRAPFDKVAMCPSLPRDSPEGAERLLAMEEALAAARSPLPRGQHRARRPRPAPSQKYDIEGGSRASSRYREGVDREPHRLPVAPLDSASGTDRARVVHTLNGHAVTARAMIADPGDFRRGRRGSGPRHCPFGATARSEPATAGLHPGGRGAERSKKGRS